MNALSSPSIIKSAVLMCVIVLAAGVNEGYGESPSVAAPLVREGAFALKLAGALGMGQPASEIEAESMLGAAGVAPRNGWIADYPVTPDIIGELRSSISYAAQARTLSMDSATALRALESVQADENVSVVPEEEGPPSAAGTQIPEVAYPDQTVINSYYYDQGPPIVTYYTPPLDYFYLYSWVPYPFWWGGFSFGGYYILNDFHRHYRDRGHFHTVSNHFNDTRSHRVFRIDPVNRGNGRTYAGIGAPRSGRYIRTGTSGSGDRIFNPGPGRANMAPSTQGGNSGRRSSGPAVNSNKNTNPFHEQKVYRQAPYSGSRSAPSSSQGGGRDYRTPHTPTPSPPAVRGDGRQGRSMERGGGGRDMRR